MFVIKDLCSKEKKPGRFEIHVAPERYYLMNNKQNFE